MLNFQPFHPEDAAWLRPYLSRTPNLSCEYSPGCLIMWGNAQIAPCGDFYVPMVNYGDGPLYLCPIGGTNFESILPILIEDSRERGIPFRMTGITEPVRARLAETTRFSFACNRNYADYVYSIEALSTLSGRKLQAKRNHINNLVKRYPDWVCEPITSDNLEECQDMVTLWYEEHLEAGGTPNSYRGEQRALSIAFSNYEAMGFDGLLLRLDGRVAAFSMGQRINQTSYDVNFEKAFASIQGAYALINREFSRMIHETYPDIEFLDREDDMGLDTLRKAKLSYHPAIVLDKYTAFLPEESR